MSKPTKRVRVKVTIEYQMTENRAEVVKELLTHVATALYTSSYPNEYINPSKGDYADIQFSEPEFVKEK